MFMFHTDYAIMVAKLRWDLCDQSGHVCFACPECYVVDIAGALEYAFEWSTMQPVVCADCWARKTSTGEDNITWCPQAVSIWFHYVLRQCPQ
jgi:hypothetical protein